MHVLEETSRTTAAFPHVLSSLAANMASGSGSPVVTWAPWVLRSAATVDYATLVHHLACCS